MTGKKLKALVRCIQGIVLQAFSMYALAPILFNLITDNYSRSETEVAVPLLFFWLVIEIISTILISSSAVKLSDNENSSNDSIYSKFTSNLSKINPISQEDSVNDNTWTCKNCGKVNQNYVGTCGCGQQKTGG